MITEADPVIRNWYQHLDKGQRFRVVAVDSDAGLIEIQHFDGDLEEIELAVWRQMDLEPIEAPENWAGALDISEKDDLGTEVTDTDKSDWNAPLEDIRPPNPEKIFVEPEKPQNDWAEDVAKEEPWEGE